MSILFSNDYQINVKTNKTFYGDSKYFRKFARTSFVQGPFCPPKLPI